MLPRILAALLFALLPGVTHADHGLLHPTPSEIVDSMRSCAPITASDVSNGGETVRLTIVYNQEASAKAADPSLLHIHELMVLRATTRAEVGNVEAFWHAAHSDVAIVFGRIPRLWAQANLDEALDLAFERGRIYSCFQSAP